MNLFTAALQRKNENRPPVWFMRQAGRYHSHYQDLRRRYSFMELCKSPEVACEATMGPIRDFDFDAAILFSDLLFPLEVMGMGLRYDEGPQLDWHLRDLSGAKKLRGGANLAKGLVFQAEALRLIRERLPAEKGLLGFVGGPLTLFCYAVEGSHQGRLDSAFQGLGDGRFDEFFEKLRGLLVENMVLQAQAGASGIAVMDTCAGEFDPDTYRTKGAPYLKLIVSEFKARCPDVPLVYYSKKTGPRHWESLFDLGLDGLGIDWNHNIAEVLTQYSNRWSIQGNVDPKWLFLNSTELEQRLRRVFQSVCDLPPATRKGWVCGLGHGVLPKTPENNVRLFLKLQKEFF